ncbi:MAG TPA: PilZ domain-containing protein [Gammaproteobacteria bacterium]|nr:PilZ domain-containing protein [Gammaproteobacteria bacterium]
MSGQKKAPSEMRKTVRVDVPGTVCVTDRQANRDFGQLANISEEGLMILVSEPVVENSVFQLALGFCNEAGDSEPIEIGVECLWCNQSNKADQYWAGFYVIDISEQDQERLRQLIR